MIHRGNFNTSDLSAAMVIFMDQWAKPAGRQLDKIDTEGVRRTVGIIDEAILLDAAGNIVRVDQDKLRSLPEPFQSHLSATSSCGQRPIFMRCNGTDICSAIPLNSFN